jgi:hypothetical protein
MTCQNATFDERADRPIKTDGVGVAKNKIFGIHNMYIQTLFYRKKINICTSDKDLVS